MSEDRNMRNPNTKLIDWGFMNEWFPRSIRPMDLDGVLEFNNRFLVLEWKNEGERTIGKGQVLTFQALASYQLPVGCPVFTVVQIVGRQEKNTVITRLSEWVVNVGLCPVQGFEHSLYGFRAYCRRWQAMTKAYEAAYFAAQAQYKQEEVYQ